MRLINSSAKAILQDAGTDTVNTLVGIYKQIELAGRTCYKSEDKITPTSAQKDKTNISRYQIQDELPTMKKSGKM